ncbi:hypothetical protein SPAR72_0912 [Streptococcus pneumoniae GA41538]|nr:hypothetical protein SPAR72_0912 [Streptococcus pneumoniae GA41538]EHE81425.1 hypothetical protein SPAR28_0807 [Streptococcus pneumoniae GA13338]EHZ23623.1 hypothetical protein SPAR33_0903 [Streptococcus pneumoniae GA13723]EJH04026.1 hypothetical protein SPAR160_2235 [Streptococcus pneumoniae GA58581]
MGLFSTQNRLHNIYREFTHYKYYRAQNPLFTKQGIFLLSLLLF